MFNPTITDISCNTFTDGAVTLNPSGGNGGLYNINWGTANSSALGDGSYLVTVTDPTTITANNLVACENDTIIVMVEPAYFSADFSVSSNTICLGNDIDLEFNSTNGVPPFVLNYTDVSGNPNTLNISNTPNPYLETVIPNTSGNYTITSFTDNDGCSATLGAPIQNVIVNPLPSISFDIAVPEMCIGETRSLNINNLTGASPLTVYYTITDINSSSSTSEIVGPGGTTISLSPSQTTTYSVYAIEDMNNCENLTPINQTLIVNELPEMQLTTPSEICDNDSARIIVNLSGNGPWNFQYSDYGSILPFNTVNITDTIYLIMQNSDADVVISNFSDSKCPNTVNTETIISNPIPLLNLSGTGTSCADDGITNIDMTVTNGTPPYTLYYSDGISNFSPFIASPHTITTTGPGTYVITNLIDNKNCKADLSLLNNTLISYETPQLTTTYSTEICEGDLATINLEFTAGTPPYDVDYTFNSSNQTTTINFTTGELNLIATNPSNITINSITGANCPNTINEDIQININSVPVSTLSGNGEICDDGGFTYIKFETIGGLPLYDIIYTDGTDNFTLTNIGNIDSIPTSISGSYTLVSVTDQKGCEAISLNGQANVNINPLPDVSIRAYPLITEITDPLINFIDKSTYLSLTPGIWDFGDGSGQISNFGQLDHAYSDTGVYQVSLTTVSDFGCINTAFQTIIINPSFRIYVPNAFTPNNDLDNDYFLPIVDAVQEYELSIYDRQGQRVFRTEEYTNEYCNSGCKAAWDGKINNSSDFGTIGVYIYSINLTDFNGKLRTYEGAVTLIR
jgi:gliding motility-associated-like protein